MASHLPHVEPETVIAKLRSRHIGACTQLAKGLETGIRLKPLVRPTWDDHTKLVAGGKFTKAQSIIGRRKHARNVNKAALLKHLKKAAPIFVKEDDFDTLADICEVAASIGIPRDLMNQAIDEVRAPLQSELPIPPKASSPPPPTPAPSVAPPPSSPERQALEVELARVGSLISSEFDRMDDEGIAPHVREARLAPLRARQEELEQQLAALGTN